MLSRTQKQILLNALTTTFDNANVDFTKEQLELIIGKLEIGTLLFPPRELDYLFLKKLDAMYREDRSDTTIADILNLGGTVTRGEITLCVSFYLNARLDAVRNRFAPHSSQSPTLDAARTSPTARQPLISQPFSLFSSEMPLKAYRGSNPAPISPTNGLQNPVTLPGNAKVNQQGFFSNGVVTIPIKGFSLSLMA